MVRVKSNNFCNEIAAAYLFVLLMSFVRDEWWER